jgi:hypothetical protein
MRLVIQVVVLFSLLFLSCEYVPTAENFVEINPPEPTHQLDLTLFPVEDTIKIFNRTDLKFQFDTYGLQMLGATISLGDKNYTASSENPTISVEPDFYTPGVYTLTARFYSNSGSGSIADRLGGEGYMIEKNYQVLIDGSDAEPITPIYTINKDNLLELSWPVCTNFNFYSYVLKKGHQKIAEIKNRNITRFVDSLYVGGNAGYEIEVHVYTQNRFTTGQTLLVTIEAPQPLFELISLDSLKVHWRKPAIRSTVRLAYGVGISTYKKHYIPFGDTSCVIPVPAFGVQHIFQLSTQPYHDSTLFDARTLVQRYYTFGTSLQHPTNRIVYNKNSSLLFSYSNSDREINSLDAVTRTKLKSVTLPEIPFLAATGVSSHKLVFLSFYNTFYVFDDEQLTAFESFKVGGFNGYGMFVLTDNHYIAMKCYDQVHMINITTKALEATLTLPQTFYNTRPIATASQDGSYVCAASNAGYKLYRYKDKAFTLVSLDSRSYASALFNPLNPSEIAFTFTDSPVLEIRSVPDFTLKRSIQLPGKYFVENFDTSTGLLLLNNYSKLLAVNTATGLILKGTNCTSDKYLLHGNTLYNPYGYFVDMTNWWK